MLYITITIIICYIIHFFTVKKLTKQIKKLEKQLNNEKNTHETRTRNLKNKLMEKSAIIDHYRSTKKTK